MKEKPTRERKWSSLLKLTRSWKMEWRVEDLLTAIARETVSLSGFQNCEILLVESEGLTVSGRWPKKAEVVQKKATYSLSQEVAREVVLAGKPLFGEFGSEGVARRNVTKKVKKTVHCAPLMTNRGILGALYMDTSKKGMDLNHEDQEMIEMLTLQAATALENSILYRSAITDAMTGLYSHIYFQQEVERLGAKALRSGDSLSMMILDLDHFKEINDVFGHEVGNQYILKASDVLKSSIRSSDTLARFGGDEFEILFPETSLDGVGEVADKIMKKISKIKLPDKSFLSVSIGIANYPTHVSESSELFIEADAALYKAKEAGRSCYRSSELRHLNKKMHFKEMRENLEAKSSLSMGVSKIGNTSLIDFSKPSEGKREFDSQKDKIDGYEVIRRLEADSHGELFLVKQPELQREVALKRPHARIKTSDAVSYFEEEARLTASLNHPGIASIYTMGVDRDGRRYYTMKPLHGISLAAILKKVEAGDEQTIGKYPENKLLDILLRVSETMAYAHQKGATHLNLTPVNIIIGEFGQVTIIDWGSSSSSKQSAGELFKRKNTEDWLCIGSPEYRAPEQLHLGRGKLGFPTDTYALGVILFQILTGRMPFEATSDRELIDKILHSTSPTPEEVSPYKGIDPILSRVCAQSLIKTGAERPEMEDFNRKLGSFTLREKEWHTKSFEEKGTILPRAWSAICGDWKMEDGAWVSVGRGENILLWKKIIPSDFRFVSECWTEEGGELSLICHGPSLDSDFREPRKKYEGYCFEFGAEGNIGTKLARNAHDVMVDRKYFVQPGRHYRIEVSYESGWLSCYIDGKQIFHYHELFPLSGNTIGFYTYGSGVHFRPLLAQYQIDGLNIPVIRMADDLYENKLFPEALDRYQEIVDAFPDRMEGLEATLKIGLCQASLKDYSTARKTFRSLKGTSLEAFGISEEASIGLELGQEKYQEKGLDLFRKLLLKFPYSQAKVSIMESELKFERELKPGKHLPVKKKVFRDLLEISRGIYSSPVQSQIASHFKLVEALKDDGQWVKADLENKKFLKKVHPSQYSHHIADTLKTSLAVGETNFAKKEIFGDELSQFTHTRLLGLCYLYGQNKMTSFLEGLDKSGGLGLRGRSNLAWFYYSANRLDLGRKTILACDLERLGLRAFMNLSHDCGDENLYPFVCSLFEKIGKMGDTDSSLENYYRGVWLLENVYLNDAVHHLSSIEIMFRMDNFAYTPEWIKNAYVLQVLIGSLGFLEADKFKALKKNYEHHLSGTRLDLVRIFFGLKKPLLGDLWPKPYVHPEWRLWLAIWLEAKGESKPALELARGSLVPFAGHTHRQPAFKKLIQRIEDS